MKTMSICNVILWGLFFVSYWLSKYGTETMPIKTAEIVMLVLIGMAVCTFVVSLVKVAKS